MKVWGLVPVLATSILVFPQDSTNTGARFSLDKNVPVPMRDGVVLRADVLRPAEIGKYPVLVYRTPYGKDAAQQEYATFRHAAERGYAVVIQDVRGRYHSDGDFRPYENEGRDGYDTIEWSAAQPWSNGAVGMFGLSYPGAVQWLAAVQSPPHLKAMVPAMTFSTPQNFFYAGGTWDMSWIEWIWDNIAWDTRARENLAGPRTYEEALGAWKQEGPTMLNTLPLLALKPLQQVAPYYFDWLRHPPEDSWWNWSELRDKYSRTNAAVLNLSAWYDDNYGPEGATTNFNGLLRHRLGEPDARTHLLLGPWVHGVDSTARTRSGEREFGPAAAIDYDDVVLSWMDHYLKGVTNSVGRGKPVRYFVMGLNQWRDADQWPPTAKKVPMFLAPPTGSGRSGQLQTTAFDKKDSFSEFVSDPANPVTNPYDSSGAHDYARLSDRADVLTFDSAALERDIEVTGPISVRVFVSCNCQDFDLWTRLLDVGPAGAAFNLMSPGLDVQRASYRDLSRGRQLLSPGKIYELKLERLITSNMFAQGHRIRLQISASFSPNFSRNLQSGKSEVTSAEMKKSNIRVFHDADHPSQLLLPVVSSVR
ncbi:MAG TPA: CocE/NonD family hydrolase [Candidatus Sulfotelmatobacter sp.]|nr:CocE/NonD family hydrolase [Candidatus Sulfotelmatobacter sp.]